MRIHVQRPPNNLSVSPSNGRQFVFNISKSSRLPIDPVDPLVHPKTLQASIAESPGQAL
jgi:hypothetical protein